MKQLMITALFSFFLLSANAQTGVVYTFTFRIDDELTTQLKVQSKEHKILNISTVEDMPKELSDTILLITEQMLGASLGSELISMVPEEKMVMAALPEHLMYLPANRFKKAVETYDSLDLFVNIDCHIAASGGVKVTLGNNSRSKVKPKLRLIIKTFDKSKTLLEKKEVTLKDFEKLRSRTFEKTYGISSLNTNEVTESETLNANDVLRMYVMGLEELLLQ
ncbi:MAG: hypothetical protein DCO96_03515 [Fluviicola sp. XM-24bin1]|nr:MAG: hypothetical protein DCO96_03515 [Fluviicola sp. XM-24bin1]